MCILITLSTLYAQEALPYYIDANYRSIDVKLGFGKIEPELFNINFLYQRNIAKRIPTVLYSELNYSLLNRNPENQYLTTNYFSWVEAVGIGGTIGKRWFNNSLFIVGGGRYYHSKLYVKEALQPELVTSKVLPELALLYNLKIGKKRWYFSAQYYKPLYPFAMLKYQEVNRTISVGMGYRLNGK
jgi:hypothetical protein